MTNRAGGMDSHLLKSAKGGAAWISWLSRGGGGTDRDASTAVLLRCCEAKSSLSMTMLELLVLRLAGCGGVHAGGVEGESFDFGFGALRLDFLIVPEKRDSGGVADLDGNLTGGADGSVRGSDQRFLRVRLAIGDDGDPCRFVCTDDQRHGSRSLGRWNGWRIEGANGDITFYDDFSPDVSSDFFAACAGGVVGDGEDACEGDSVIGAGFALSVEEGWLIAVSAGVVDAG